MPIEIIKIQKKDTEVVIRKYDMANDKANNNN